MIRVDAHHHFWTVARGDYGWLRPGSPIHRDYGLADLRPLLGDVTATVLVQAAPTEAETRFMLDVAARSDGLVRGVVGWADFAASDAPERIAALAQDPLLKGLRPMLHDLPDPEWILGPDKQPALAALVRHGLRFDALVKPPHLPALLRLLERHPELPAVIDHGAKPGIAVGAWQPWADQMTLLAQETGAFCKLSGLVTEASAAWTPDALRRYADHLLERFTPARVMWGSDWPVVDLAGGYRRWREATETLLQGLSVPERDAVLGGTAVGFYGLDSSGAESVPRHGSNRVGDHS